MNTVIQFINEQYAERISIADVAESVNMSVSRLSRYISKAIDTSFTGFVNRLRVHKVCELHSDTQISSICYAVGFNNVANFNRRFLEVKGMVARRKLLAAGARVPMVDRDDAALKMHAGTHGDAAIPLVIDLLDANDCATLLPKVLKLAGQLDILHANARTYVGGDLVESNNRDIDRMLNLSVTCRTAKLNTA